jgi:N-dimethylarginine dimethylaminohydrolase
MINSHLLVSDADHFANLAKINPYYNETKINLKKAQDEHAALIDCFKQAGIKITKIPPPKSSQDGIYTANWALVHGNTAVLSRLPAARRAEEPYARETLQNLGFKTISIPDDLLFSGQGDALICGNYLFAGQTYRSDPAATAFAAKTLGLELVQLQTIPKLNPDGSIFINPETTRPDSYFYDLDLGLAIIDENTIAYCPEAFDAASQVKLESLNLNKIPIDYEEAIQGFAANLVSTGQTVVMSAHAPQTRAKAKTKRPKHPQAQNNRNRQRRRLHPLHLPHP